MRVVVNGAGIAGLACALALSRLGWQVLVTEIAPAPRRGGYMIDFFGPGWEAAERLGALEALRRRGRLYQEARFVDEHGRTTGRLGFETVDELARGRFFSIMRPDIEESLRGCLPPDVDLRYGTTVSAVEPDGTGPVEVRLSDGSTVRADLVLAADGLHSALRTMLLGPESALVRELGFQTAAFVCTDEALATRLGARLQLSDVVDGQAWLFALDRRTVAAFVVVADDGPVPADVRAMIRAELGRHGPDPASLVDRVPDDVWADTVAQVVAPRWRSGRVLLMGDAAHAVSLLAGQGASLAIAGADALARALEEHDDLEAALAAYETRWRAVVGPVQATARRFGSGFVPRTRRQLWIRRLVLHAARVPLVSRRLVGSLTGGVTH
ncbi:FAD-dependent oxidoreductase [Desertihabitans brevis]|uniref:FAD-dependent oxidoreductase n=1 Tax=Desertihabitans brevis TaxID=2268447 RepID=A0A367YRG1_9ACTN|nr:FAD-dependent monooxygenase [Desertihabitans brevis]RCK68424.1 FAD-dependent oxidoreductase [Desertihabitans brevis]